jgi:hypothetical protein
MKTYGSGRDALGRVKLVEAMTPPLKPQNSSALAALQFIEKMRRLPISPSVSREFRRETSRANRDPQADLHLFADR